MILLRIFYINKNGQMGMQQSTSRKFDTEEEAQRFINDAQVRGVNLPRPNGYEVIPSHRILSYEVEELSS